MIVLNLLLPRPGFAMSLLFLGLCLVTSACGTQADLEAYNRMERAQQIFDRAVTADDFLQAAAIYRQIEADGFINGALLYNMGNAYMQADRRGHAIAAYRQARRYRPRDPFLEANLKYALGMDTPLEGRRSILDHLIFWKGWLSYPEKYSATLGAAAITLLLALIALLRKRKVVWKRLRWIMLIATLLLAFSAGYDTYFYEYSRYGVITDDDVVARKGSSENFEPALMDALSQGTEFRVMEVQGDWLLIRLERMSDGCWITSKDAAVY